MTRTLADIMRPLVNSGMNPNNISNLLAETKDLALTRSLLNATGAISDATAPGQTTLTQATALNRATLPNFVNEVMQFQTCSPGHKLVRRFVVDASEAVCHSQFSFREKKVGGAIIAIDHTLKTLKGQKVAQEKVSKNRLTVWSNELGAPMIALSTATTSMDDEAFVMAANCYGTLLVDGRAPPKLCFLDNPARDAGGVLRRFDSLKDTSAPEKFSWSGPVVCIDDAAGDARALAALRDVRRVAVDMEWRAQPLSNVSVVQIGVTDAVYLWRVKDSVPAGLAAILRNEGIEKIGVNFQGDITRLTKQYEGVEVKGEIIELSDLANDTLKSQKRRWSLADLVMELLNRTLDKELGGGGRYGRWDEWPLDQDAQQYAANDAAATFMVHAALLDPKLRGWVWVAPRDRAAAAQDDGDAEADGDAELDGDAEGRVLADGAAELDGGDDGAADDGADDGEDDGADDDADDVGDLRNDDVEQEAPPPDSVLAAATKLVVEYERTNVAESPELLELPTFLDKSVRCAIHELAHDLDLISESVGVEGVDRHLVISRRERSSATPAATLEPADGAAAEEQLRQRLRRLRGLRIKYDPRHWMANWFLLAVSKNSTLYKYFCTATSDALYKIREGELERLNAHLRRRGMAEDQIKKIPRRYVRRMVRRFIPEPDVLERDLTKVYDFFKGLKDAETGQAFFRAGHKKRFDNEMRYVRKGYLSDHPDVELYVPKKKLATGFVVYRCLRTSSPLEGYHLHLRETRKASSLKAGPRWHDVVMNEFDFRWIIRALKQRGALPHRFRHYDVFLEDKLAAQVEGLVERGVMAASPRPGWRRTPYTKPVLYHGIHYNTQVIRARAAAIAPGVFNAPTPAATTPQAPRAGAARTSPPSTRRSESEWLGDVLGGPPLRLRRTADDIRRLAADPNLLTDPVEMSRAALRDGLLLLDDTARGLAEGFAAETATFEQLKDAGFLEVQQELRHHRGAPTPQAADLRFLPPNLSTGRYELPGAEAAPLAGPVIIAPPPPAASPSPVAPPLKGKRRC